MLDISGNESSHQTMKHIHFPNVPLRCLIKLRVTFQISFCSTPLMCEVIQILIIVIYEDGSILNDS